MAKGLSYAEELSYWQTSRSAPDIWTERTKRQIEAIGGKVLAEGFGSDEQGRSAYMLGFQLEGDLFKIIWPVLESKKGNILAARIQAATMLYHHIKALCMASLVLGARSTFFSYLLLRDGRTAAQMADEEVNDMIPELIARSGRLLSPPDDGD